MIKSMSSITSNIYMIFFLKRTWFTS